LRPVSPQRQLAADPRVAPGRVFAGETNDELAELGRLGRATDALPSPGAVVTSLATSRAYQRSNVSAVTIVSSVRTAARPSAFAASARRRRCGSGEPQTPITELLAQDAILGAQVGDRTALAVIEQRGEQDEGEVEGSSDHDASEPRNGALVHPPQGRWETVALVGLAPIIPREDARRPTATGTLDRPWAMRRLGSPVDAVGDDGVSVVRRVVVLVCGRTGGGCGRRR
jgi:hypothetical protein